MARILRHLLLTAQNSPADIRTIIAIATATAPSPAAVGHRPLLPAP